MDYNDLDDVKDILLKACEEKKVMPNEVMTFLNCMLVAYCKQHEVSEADFDFTCELMKKQFRVKMEKTE
jgi:pyrroline-5-carboxylate reductase